MLSIIRHLFIRKITEFAGRKFYAFLVKMEMARRSLQSEGSQGLPIIQIQSGPLKVVIPPTLTMSQKLSSRPLVGALKSPFKYKGSLLMLNKGKTPVAFKIMSRNGMKLQVKRAYGVIQSNETINLKVLTHANPSFNNYDGKDYGLLVLATTCKLFKDEISQFEFKQFWKPLLNKGNHAFLEIHSINQICFFDARGSLVHEVNYNDQRRHLDQNDLNGYLSSSSASHSDRSRHGTDIEDNVSSNGSVQEIMELSKDLEKSRKTMINWASFMVVALIIMCLAFIQQNLGRLEMEIVLTKPK